MKRVILPLACAVSLFADVMHMLATPENIAKFEQIIDVRTPKEWHETGIIKGSKTIQYTGDKYSFLDKLKLQVDVTKPIALICRSGFRSESLARVIGDDLNITNLKGGLIRATKDGYKLVPYEE